MEEEPKEESEQLWEAEAPPEYVEKEATQDEQQNLLI